MRLKYYPTGMPLFSASRGMKRPIVEKISNKEELIKEQMENIRSRKTVQMYLFDTPVDTVMEVIQIEANEDTKDIQDGDVVYLWLTFHDKIAYVNNQIVYFRMEGSIHWRRKITWSNRRR